MDVENPEIAALFPKVRLDRRGFVVASLATGFALSVRPAGATIVTDSAGLVAGEVRIALPDGYMPAYRAMPAGRGPFPTLLVIEEIFGVHEHIQDMCRRFAKKGYFAVAPELYARLGDPAKLPNIAEIMALVDLAPDRQTMADLDLTAIWAGRNGGDDSKLAITGWCRGGRTVWMYAAHNPHLRAAVAWYGPLSGKPTPEMPTDPLDVASRIKVPVLGLYGGRDQSIPASDIAEMKRRLAAAGDEASFVIYRDAGHGFNADYRPSYDPAAATDAMERCIDWLRSHGAW